MQLLEERGATISEEFFRLAQQEERLIVFQDLSLGVSKVDVAGQ